MNSINTADVNNEKIPSMQTRRRRERDGNDDENCKIQIPLYIKQQMCFEIEEKLTKKWDRTMHEQSMRVQLYSKDETDKFFETYFTDKHQ